MHSAFRSTAVTLALAAMVLRALLPAGWMPSPAQGSLVICTVQGPIRIAAGGEPQNKSDGAHHSEACPFAAAPNLAPPELSAGAAPSSLVFANVPLASLTSVLIAAARHAPQAPRAPPALA